MIISDLNGVPTKIRFGPSLLSGNTGLAVWTYANPDSSLAPQGNCERGNLIHTLRISLTGPPKPAVSARVN